MYKNIYYFSVLDELKHGNKVYCCDREAKEVFCLNEAPVGLFADILNISDAGYDRYEFWIEKEGEK